MRATNWPSVFTTGSLPFLLDRKRSFASAREIPSVAVKTINQRERERERRGRERRTSEKIDSHDRGEGCSLVFNEINVTACDHSQEARPHEAIFCDRNTTEAIELLEIQDISDGVVGREARRVGDEAIFVFLDESDFEDLLFDGHVVMDHA
jgi:hypothetical protein